MKQPRAFLHFGVPLRALKKNMSSSRRLLFLLFPSRSGMIPHSDYACVTGVHIKMEASPKKTQTKVVTNHPYSFPCVHYSSVYFFSFGDTWDFYGWQH
jgi:hypothetical protein